MQVVIVVMLGWDLELVLCSEVPERGDLASCDWSWRGTTAACLGLG